MKTVRTQPEIEFSLAPVGLGKRAAWERDLPESDYWQTPPAILARVREVATYELHDPCPANPTEDGLTSRWGRSVFLNPPYSYGQIQRWADKAKEEFLKGRTEEIFWLINYGNTRNRIRIKERAIAIVDLHRRIAFVDPRTGQPGRQNARDAVIYVWSAYPLDEDELNDQFADLGEVFIRGGSRKLKCEGTPMEYQYTGNDLQNEN